ncbi:MAG: hypothetical protein RL033_5545 [Pseudomonadota bacterium]|jgi:gamma-glutamylcyclotransferase (GGCT)/AIG2-like uncharacterized protein YtfP
MSPSTSFRLFAYGTLQLPEVLQAVIGQRREGVPALLSGYRRFCVPGKPYPAMVVDARSSVPGLLYDDLSAAELELLDYYEGELYERHELLVRVQSAQIPAMSYVLSAAHGALVTEEPWDLQAFEREHLTSYLQRLGHTRRAP